MGIISNGSRLATSTAYNNTTINIKKRLIKKEGIDWYTKAPAWKAFTALSEKTQPPRFTRAIFPFTWAELFNGVHPNAALIIIIN